MSGDSRPLSLLIEFYLSGFFEHQIEFTRSRDIWCDGIVGLRIERTSRLSIVVCGVAYCPHDWAPFELEFHFKRRRDIEPLKVVLKFGELNSGGELLTHSRSKSPEAILARRPNLNRDWAVAVELTPDE